MCTQILKTLRVFANNHENTANIVVTNIFYQVGGFANVE